jgi:Fe-S cluster biosynthesis and repair protein YggX
MSEERLVKCGRYGTDLPGLNKPPLKGRVGEVIYANVSARAWDEWKEMRMKVLNEYRLNMADLKDHNFLQQQMVLFLNLQTFLPELNTDSAPTPVGDPNRAA